MARLTGAQMSYIKAWSSNKTGYNKARKATKGRARSFQPSLPGL